MAAVLIAVSAHKNASVFCRIASWRTFASGGCG